MLTAAEKIHVILLRMGLTMTDLAHRLGQSKQNVNNKMSRGDFKESDLRQIAAALDCELEISFTMPNGDRI